MLVKDVLNKIGIESQDTREVKGISFDSKAIKDGYIFVAYKGCREDGNDYIYKAFENGAVCVISDRLVGYDIYKSNNIDEDKIKLCKIIYKTNKIKIIGITGTNGKTSSAYLIYQNLNRLGVKTTYIGTLGIIDNNYKKEISNTTPDFDVLSQEIYRARKRKCEYVVMEVSAHALTMNRVKGINFDVIVFTNLSQDHLDYYDDLSNYFNAKKILFDKASNNCIGIINNEDEYSKKIVKDFKGKIIRYGNNSEYDYTVLKNDLEGLIFKINEEIVKSNLIYKTNIYNLLVTYVVLDSLGYEESLILDSLSKSETIEGRMQLIYKKDYYIVVDYAHTPDAFERILKETNSIKKGNCVVLFGCGGNRDITKRSIIGNIVSKYADRIYITNDNPRYENENKIIDDILKGIKNKENVVIEKDRELAIKKAINSLSKNDILLVLGKGHENYQIINDNKIHLSDKEIIETCIKK